MSVWIHHFTTGLGNSSNRNGCHKNSWSQKTCIYGWLFLGPTPGSVWRGSRSWRPLLELEMKRRFIQRFVITEKAPTNAVYWCKAPTKAVYHLRHYAKWMLTPR